MMPVADARAGLREVVGDPTGASATGTVVFPPDLPVFAGHFPGDPVVPGVYILGAVQAVVEAALRRGPLRVVAVERCKWTSISRPGSPLVVQARWTTAGDGWEVGADVTRDGDPACRCRLRLVAAG
jgi:3-hydroxyacyl-[acyl-carrier-protein] dehydratase